MLLQKISLLNKEDIHDIQPSVRCTLLELISFVAIVFDIRASSWFVLMSSSQMPDTIILKPVVRVAAFPSNSQVHLNYVKYCKKSQLN